VVPIKHIASASNPRYKRWRKYLNSPEAEDCPWIAVEGKKQISELSEERGIELLLTDEPASLKNSAFAGRSREVVQVSRKMFRGLSRTRSPQGMLAFLDKPKWSWKELTPYVLFLNRLRDPGNLGVLIRTAAATGIFSIVTSSDTVSCFNDKVVRASAGYLFKTPFLEKIDIADLKRHGYEVFVAHHKRGDTLFNRRFEPPLALMVSNEGEGVDLTEVDQSWQLLRIPMSSRVDSLNVSVSGSLLMYEVFRGVSEND
jgi:TrmH family RNA methyltransferase